MVKCYLGIGSNLGDREGYIQRAIELLRASPGIKVTRVSSLYETDPVGGPPQGKFFNGAIEIQTDYAPHELLSFLKKMEEQIGRKNRQKNWPREIDLDILLYGEQRIQESDLEIPHPRMFERDFVLVPLREIAIHLKI